MVTNHKKLEPQHILNFIRHRPRFKVETSYSEEELLKALKYHKEKHDDKIGGYVGKTMSVFRVRQSKNEYWAPQLQIRVEEDPWDKKTYIYGLLGPKPAVWTFFVFIYAILITFGTLFLMITFVQISLNNSPYWIWIGLACYLGVGITYFMAMAGKRKAKEENLLLRRFIEIVLKREHIIDEESSD